MNTIAIYMRLSSEDAHAGESYSIQNQRDLLYGYLKSHREFDGCTVMEFCDDGYSGTNFNRPDVKKMLAMAGNPIKCIIVKDFSRFGRSLIDVGDYLDQIFPFLGVRFIAVNEDFDSKNSNGSAVSLDVSLKAMIYEMYSRDISDKIRCVQQAKMRKGEYLCAIAFYGYKRSETQKNKLEIDEPAATIVRRIFDLACIGHSCREIAVKLNQENIPSPLMYRKANGTADMRGWKKAGDTTLWTRENVRRIVSDERFTGCLISRKRTKVDVSSKRTEPVPEKDWIVAKDAHDAIVSKEVFDTAQAILRKYPNRKMPSKPKQLFRALLKCTECGRTLGRTECKQPYFYCPTKLAVPDSACAHIKLMESDLSAIVLASIQTQVRLLSCDKVKDGGTDDNERFLQAEIKRCASIIHKYQTAQSFVYEDFVEGRIDQQEYQKRKQEAANYQEEASKDFAVLTHRLNEMQSAKANGISKDLGRYDTVNVLTRELLTGLIKEIRVSGTDCLEIVWNFNDMIKAAD